MNRNTLKLLFLAAISIGLGVYVFNKKSSNKSNNFSSYSYIASDVEEFIEINDPNKNINQFFSSNLIVNELENKGLLDELEKFWNQKDSAFNYFKSISNQLTLFYPAKGKIFFLMELDSTVDSLRINSKYNYSVENGFVLASKGDLDTYQNKLKSTDNLSSNSFFINRKIKISDNQLKVYQKKNKNWSVFDVKFLPEQIFSSGIQKEKINNGKLKTEFDFSILSYFPQNFIEISINQFDSVSELDIDSNAIQSLFSQCECDAFFQAYNWVQSPKVSFYIKNSDEKLISFNISSLANFTQGINSLNGDSLGFEGEENKVIEIGNIFKFGTQHYYPYILRMDNLVYFSTDNLILEKLKAKVNSGFNLSMNKELLTFLETNINVNSEEIVIRKGLNFLSINSNKGVGLFQKSFQSSELTYNSYVFSSKVNLDGGKVNPKWSKDFENQLNNKIYKFKNHKSNDYFYLIQDTKNELYFISPNGDIQWKKNIENPIIGGIKKIDFLGNGKNQMMFATKNKLYLIDILGRNVGSFPVLIKDSVTENVSIVDYDNNQNFRFLVPTSKGIKSIDSKGNLVKGWAQPLIGGGVQGDIHHLLINNLDYVLVKANSNAISLFNRKGEVRHKVSAKFGTPWYFTIGSSIEKTRAVFLDKTTNSISKQFFSNSAPTLLLSPTEKIKSFYFIDYDKDGQKEYVVVFKNKIVLYGQDLIIKEKIELLEDFERIEVWKGGYSYLNQFNELIVYHNGKKSIIENTQDYLIDKHSRFLRILIKNKSNLKLLHL